MQLIAGSNGPKWRMDIWDRAREIEDYLDAIKGSGLFTNEGEPVDPSSADILEWLKSR